MNIEMVDLKTQYEKIKSQIDVAVLNVIENAHFINGPQVEEFSSNLSSFLGGAFVIPCANGTDALQIAMMALNLKPGDEVIVPCFTYVATAEVIGLLNLVPVMVDVDPDNFNISKKNIENAITTKTKAIVPVHLYGQSADMEGILKIANENNLFVIEDTAQALGAIYTFNDGRRMMTGTMGNIGCTSFFPSKNLGCFGDGGALFTMDMNLAAKIKSIANHGQEKKYIHKYIGVNSRLDTIQAAILNVKLKHLNEYTLSRNRAAEMYDKQLSNIDDIIVPYRSPNSTHVFHQYTLKVRNGKRDQLKKYLEGKNIPTMVYYPIPLNQQEAFKDIGYVIGELPITNELCSSVLSLPMHTELNNSQQEYIIESIKSFFNI